MIFLFSFQLFYNELNDLIISCTPIRIKRNKESFLYRDPIIELVTPPPEFV